MYSIDSFNIPHYTISKNFFIRFFVKNIVISFIKAKKNTAH